jgi:hypothetical protein
VVEWSRALDVRLSEWCCSVTMVWVQIPRGSLLYCFSNFSLSSNRRRKLNRDESNHLGCLFLFKILLFLGSVVDYFISSESLIKNILFFKVNKFLGELSDHCQISIMLRTGHQIYNTSDSRSPYIF